MADIGEQQKQCKDRSKIDEKRSLNLIDMTLNNLKLKKWSKCCSDDMCYVYSQRYVIQ